MIQVLRHSSRTGKSVSSSSNDPKVLSEILDGDKDNDRAIARFETDEEFFAFCDAMVRLLERKIAALRLLGGSSTGAWTVDSTHADGAGWRQILSLKPLVAAGPRS